VWTGEEMIVWGGRFVADIGGATSAAPERYPSNCCVANGTPGCTDPACEEIICSTDPYCCDVLWDQICADAASADPTCADSCGNAGPIHYSSGGRYDPVSDSWTPTSTHDSPSARHAHTAVWTGSEMIVWGGATNGQPSGGDIATSTGGRYDPATDSWAPISLGNAPTARVGHTATWTGTEMLVWGGGSLGVNSGARYNPATDSWSPMSTINAPSARTRHHAIFDGQRLVIWGGVSDGVTVSDGAVYDPATDVWSALPTQGSPDSARTGLRNASVVWTGTDMLVRSPEQTYLLNPSTDTFVSTYESDASRYSPQSQAWEALPDACDAAEMPIAVWLNGRMVSWTGNYSAGRIYDEAIDAWLPVTLFPGAPSENGSAVVVGDSVIVWGGKVDNAAYSNLGYRLSF